MRQNQVKRVYKSENDAANCISLAYLPVLGAGEAILTGVDFPMPLLLKIDSPTNKPDSETPKFKMK